MTLPSPLGSVPPTSPVLPGPNRLVYCGLALILAISAFLNLYNSTFPLGYHSDEVKKVRYVKTGTQDFFHPILLLQSTKLTAAIAGCEDDQEIAVAGRTVSALAGVAIVALTFAIATELLTPVLALGCALAVACVPLIVIHAHYLKEDLIFTSMAMLSLWSLFQYLESPGRWRLVGWGITTGLAFSAQYKGFLLLALYGLIPLVAPVTSLRDYYRRLGTALLIAGTVFVLVNYPLLYDLHRFVSGVRYESRHAIRGHDIVIRAGDYFGGFHLIYSLAPGIGLVLLIWSLAGLARTAIQWQTENWRWRVLAIYALLFYFSAEISPLKPFPDFARYMIPATPILLCFGGRFAARVTGWKVHWARNLTLSTAVVGILLAGADSLLLDYFLTRDTRETAQLVLREFNAKPAYERHATLSFEDTSLAEFTAEEICRKNATHAVCSSFQYERFFFAERLPGQRPEIAELRESYRKLFERPHTVIHPAYKSYGLSNPTIRIIPICDGPPTTREED